MFLLSVLSPITFNRFDDVVVTTCFDESYIQHNPLVPTGRKAFTDYFGQFERLPERDKVEHLVDIVAERDRVIVAFKRELPDPNDSNKRYTTTWFDMFRIEDGKIAEHWDAQTK